MQLLRRRCLQLAAGAAVAPLFAGRAVALGYPSRPIHLVVGFAPGLAPDIVARVLAQPLSERLGQNIVIDDRPGAGSNIAADAVVHAPADGYTLLCVTLGNTINASFYQHLDFDITKDIAPVAGTVRSPSVLVVSLSVPAQTLPEFIAYAKANPGKVNFASGGVGTAPHLAGELFKQMVGVDMVHVPYTSSYMPDLLAGRVQVTFAPIATSIANVKAGKLRALAVTGATRSHVLPDIPTVSEFVRGYEASVWHGVGAPNGTAPDVIKKLNQQINVVIADPGVKAQLDGLGAEPMPMTPGEFGTFVAAEVKKWANVVKRAGLKSE
ncbi:MAG: tripartite tricarboxylate transporter substrate binding protein [Xanthobacteraceae bacterium]